MAAEVELKPTRLVAVPGGVAQVEVVVKNSGTVVDSFTLEVLGSAAPWCAVEPATLSLFPGQEGTARLTASPPAASVLPPGPVPYAVKVTSSEDPAGTVVEEGVVDVGGLALVHAEMSPRTSRARGRRVGRHQVAVDNRGNAPVVVRLAGVDDDDAVRIECDPPELEVAAGSAGFAKVRVRAVHRFWRGPAVTKRFRVLAQAPDEQPTRMDGSLLHEAAMPGWLPKAVGLLAVAAVALSVLWLTLLQPAVKNAATSAGTAAAQQALSQALGTSGTGAGTGGSGSGSGGGSGGGSGSASASPSTSPSVGPTLPTGPVIAAAVPFASDLTIGGGGVAASSTQQISVTDLVLQNPGGDTGVLTISVGGTTLITTQLSDFRDYDLHFITPIMVSPGEKLSMTVQCQNKANAPCSATTLVTGTKRKV